MANLLLVDDDNDLAEGLADLLRMQGHEVRTASTGEEGLQVLRAAPLADVVVLDVDMPVLGGPAMAHRMLLHDAGEEQIPIVLVSGRADLPRIAESVGTPYFLRKPCDIDAFLCLVERAIRERRAPVWDGPATVLPGGTHTAAASIPMIAPTPQAPRCRPQPFGPRRLTSHKPAVRRDRNRR